MKIRKSGKQHLTDGTELPNQANVRTLGEKETYKYFGILETGTIKQVEMKENIMKEFLRRTRNFLKTKLRCRNLIKGINNWVVLSLDIRDHFWSGPEKNAIKLMTMYNALHPIYNVDRLYESRKEGGGGLTCIEFRLDASIQRPEYYIGKHKGRLITATRYYTDNTKTNRMTITRKERIGRKTTLCVI